MKIVCPICGKILPRYESVLIHLRRVHTELSPEKSLKLAYNAKAIGFRRKKSKKAKFSIKRERNIIIGKKVTYKKEKPKSIYWEAVIKTPCGTK